MPLNTQILRWERLAPLVIVAAGLLYYCNSLSGQLFFDDFPHLSDTPRLHHLLPIWKYLAHTSRPVVDLSLALNFALGGLEVAGYHLVNLIIHIGAGLVLFGIIRRTLLGSALRQRYGASAAFIALVAALLWLVHPLQTQSVTYIIQRAESMMGLFYLLTLYAAIRWIEEPKLRHWRAGSILFCILGMGCKPVMATAPVMILLYDRIFQGGSFRQALRQRQGFYAGLAVSWVVLGLLLAGKGDDYQVGAGFGIQQMDALSYAAMQPKVILYYLRLTFWPHPLILDYGWPVANTLREVLPSMLGAGGLILAVLWGLKRNLKSSFLGGWFFLILAPSSSVIPLADLIFEHRMYLPLAAVTLGVVLLVHGIGQRMTGWPIRLKQGMAVGLALGVVTALGVKTYLRNEDYRDPVVLLRDNAARRPDNLRVRNNLGGELLRQNKLEEAEVQLRQAIKGNPRDAPAHKNLGFTLIHQGRTREGIQHLIKATELGFLNSDMQRRLGRFFAQEGDLERAEEAYRQVIRLEPHRSDAHYHLGLLLAGQGKLEAAAVCYREAIRLNPKAFYAYTNLGNVLAHLGNQKAAIAAYDKALEIDPMSAIANHNRNAVLKGTFRRDQRIAPRISSQPPEMEESAP